MSSMCGIAGLYAPTGTPNPELVDAMRAALAHRGPDEGSTDAFGRCVLGHQRLRVIDPETGYQPVTNETGALAFASETKALIRLPDVRRDVDLQAIDEYLALQYVPGDRTGFAAIKRLPPGHVLVTEGESERIERYWEPQPSADAATEDEWL